MKKDKKNCSIAKARSKLCNKRLIKAIVLSKHYIMIIKSSPTNYSQYNQF